jgi:uncharacterized protein (TIGR03435 family)
MIPFIANHLWQSTIFVVLIAVVAACLRRSQARVRYTLWFCASLKFFLPFALLMTLGQQFKWSVPRKVTSVAVSTVLTQASEPFLLVTTSSVNGLPVTRSTWNPAWRILPYIWLAGCVAVLAVRIRQWRRIRRAMLASTPLDLPDLDIPFNVQVRTTSELLEPGVVGWRRPILLFPAGLQDHLTESQLRAVVAHEATHIRRKDNITAAIHMTAEALFWFHPLVWWIGSRLLAERERACDEEVLRLFGDPEAYASGILAICKRYAETPLTCISGVSGSSIKKRLEAIMSNQIGVRLSFTAKAALAITGVAVMALPILVGSLSASQAQSAPTPISEKFNDVTIQPCLQEAPRVGGQRGSGMNSLHLSAGRAYAECLTVATMIRTAYGFDPVELEFMNTNDETRRSAVTIPSKLPLDAGLGKEDGRRVRNGPDWVLSDHYIIEATTAASATGSEMMGPMLLDLLQQRFQLQAHIESEPASGFALVQAAGGFKIHPSAEGECTRGPLAPEVVAKRNGHTGPLLPDEAAAIGVKPSCQVVNMGFDGPNIRVQHLGQPDLRGTSLAVADALGVRVVDRTGLQGAFNFTWEYHPDDTTPHSLSVIQRVLSQSGTAASTAPAPSLQDALTQLGLKLEPIQLRREYVVIDRVARPSVN